MHETLKSANTVGFYTSLAVAVLTLVTFGFAIVAIPISGANCLEGCIEYPYLDTVAQFPQDYRWMPLASILMLAYVVWTAAIHSAAAPGKKVFSQVGLIFASMAALVLITDYFIQFSVVPISLISGETEGITLLTQYNAHGVFIALEELGYLLMALSFVFIAPVFVVKGGYKMPCAGYFSPVLAWPSSPSSCFRQSTAWIARIALKWRSSRLIGWSC